MTESKFKYQTGFGGHFSSEALPNALPDVGNSPATPPYGLYAEQLNGTTFTTPRHKNMRSWLYRIMPSCQHAPFKPIEKSHKLVSDFSKHKPTPNQFRWVPLPIPDTPTDFVESWVTVAGSGSADAKSGIAIHMYAATKSMGKTAFYNVDGDLLIVPSEGGLIVTTEFGKLEVPVNFICVIGKGMKFKVDLADEYSRGYIAELFEGHFQLPELGPIGSNGLANVRDFEYPVAAYEDTDEEYTIKQKFLGDLFETTLPRSPFDVVAYHGDYVPYRYDLNKFCSAGSISHDHLDPSIWTVLTIPTKEVGVAAIDFIVFMPRWICGENTFRPPFFHRNTACEFVGVIKRDDKELKLGGWLHNSFIGHGVTPEMVQREMDNEEKFEPFKSDGPNDNVTFMFESSYTLRVTDYFKENLVIAGHEKRWDFPKYFDPNNRNIKDKLKK